MDSITVIGGGLAGCEAAWQAAERGVPVELYEMRPAVATPAHTTPLLAELVCSNSFGSQSRETANGLLLHELRAFGSLIIHTADASRVPSGNALAVDRTLFAQMITNRVTNHPLIRVHRQEVTQLPAGVVVIASGPLTSDKLSSELTHLTGAAHLAFFDAIAPLIRFESIDMTIAYPGSRFGEGDSEDQIAYINCPLSKVEYESFIHTLLDAPTVPLRSFEGPSQGTYFERCLPIEVMASRGLDALAWGPMRPTGLRNPHNDARPYAVLQLRRDDLAGSLYNMVGFQTNLTYSAQASVFRTIPGLNDAEFARFGQMHRNTFINAPALLDAGMAFRDFPGLYAAGQLAGSEGYAGNAATGLLAGINAVRSVKGQKPFIYHPHSMAGALCHYLSNAGESDFQPMKVNFGLLPQPDHVTARNRNQRIAYWQAMVADALAYSLKDADIP